ncbi:hypothetical protein F4782DRAFT_501166 [Xylaria castorea]|nr:hypothetical protein F4782DRAFT_501166 [Xylaria castorea]
MLHTYTMQRLSSPSVFPALPGASTQLWTCQTRYRHSRRWWKPKKWGPRRRATWPTFQISDLLLDLDALGVKGVRTFDSQLDGVPESRPAFKKRELQPMKARVAEFEKGYDECQSSFQTISTDKFHPLQISDFDLLAATLFDSPDALNMTVGLPCHVNDPTTHAGMLGSVLDGNGIPHTIRNNTSSTITYMLSRRRVLERSRILSPDLDDEALSSMAFVRYTTFPEINRLVARIIRTPEGCRTLSGLSDELYIRLKDLIPETEPLQLLSLLNNLLINFDRHGLPMSGKLLNLGIWTSLKCQVIPTAQQYIERKCEHEVLHKTNVYRILDILLQTSIASTQFSPHNFQSNSTSRLTSLFSLLTGYVPGESQRTFSLQSLVERKRHKSFRLYIECLARLGAFRTIWHEWHGLNSELAEKDHIVTGMLEALSKNQDVRYLARSLEFAHGTGQFREDCQLDLLAISKSAEILALPESNKEDHDSAPARVRHYKELYQIFRERQIQKALPALQAFLIQTDSFS